MYRNASVDEVFRVDNTSNYEGKGTVSTTIYKGPIDCDVVGISGAPSEPEGLFYDTKGAYLAIAPENAPTVLSWEGVSVSTKPKRGKPIKYIINNIKGCVSGGLWGIMGASGSGKTTLLSVLSLRLDTHRMKIEGDIHINGKSYDKNLLKAMSGYVMQDDLVHAELTVHETLMYTAALRLPRGTPLGERLLRADETLKTVGIEYCRDVIVGDTRNKGISGGERKRLCVAMELITRPKLLFLDEPTSGLDSTTALSLIHTLKDLCERGMCTVVCTIHQPQTKIFFLLDNLLLMKKGEIIYQGACGKAEAYFAEAGYPCPEKMNPADHMLDCVTVGTHDDRAEANVLRLAVPINMEFGIEMDDFTKRAVQPWFWQLIVLTHRNMMEKIRRWDIIAMNFFITSIIAVFISCGAWQFVGNTQLDIPKRYAIMFFTVIHQGVVSSLQGTYAFPMERAIMLRERAAGAYYVSAYFLAKTGVDSFFQILAPFVFTAFIYPIIGLDMKTVNKVFIFLGFQMLLCNCAVALSNMCSCIFVSIEMSTVVLACAMEITRLYSAFFVSPKQLDDYKHWAFFDQISYMKYGYVGLVLNEFRGKDFVCDAKNLFCNGNDIMLDKGFNRYTVNYCAGCMIAYIAVCRIASYLALRLIKM